MAEINNNVTILLDRLYNLKGEENVLIQEVESKIDSIEARIEELNDIILENEANQRREEERLSVFLQQKDIFDSVFKGLTDDSFTALHDIGVDIAIGTLVSVANTNAPTYIKSLMDGVDEYKAAIARAEEEQAQAQTELVTLNMRITTLAEQRAQLVSLLEQSLSPNEIERESLTASFVKKILTSFEVFTEEEKAKLTKLIMFPDEGLLEYDRGYEDRVAKGLIGLSDTPINDNPQPQLGLPEQQPEEAFVSATEVSAPVAEAAPSEEPEEIEHRNDNGIPTFISRDGQVNLDFNKIGNTSVEPDNIPEAEVVEVTPTTPEQPTDVVVNTDAEVDVVVDNQQTSEQPVPETEEFEGPAVVLNFQQFREADLDTITESAPEQAPEDNISSDEEDTPTEEIATEVDNVQNGDVAVEPIIHNVQPEEQSVEPEEQVVEQEQPVPESEETFDTTEAEERLKKLGIDIEKFKASKVNTEPINTILKKIMSVDEEVITRNYEILKSINLEEEAYKMRFGHMYLTDVDFNKKITLLRAKNISESKIQGLIKTRGTETNKGLRIPYDKLEERIQTIENTRGKVDDSNISLIAIDMAKFEDNLELLFRYGTDIDDKEARNYTILLCKSLNIPGDTEILKDYLISILNNNSKYTLSVFWKKPQELLSDIDDLIEADLEKVIATHPEILEIKADTVLRRIKYCRENGKKVFKDDSCKEPYEYILQLSEFEKQMGIGLRLPKLEEREENNRKVAELIGNKDYVEIVMNTLHDYYNNSQIYATPDVVDDMKEKYEELIHYLEDNCKAELVGKYAYKVNGVNISKNKLERNIAVILNALASGGQNATGVEKEIVLVSALYNSRFNEEELKKVVGSCLGFNQAAQEVKL